MNIYQTEEKLEDLKTRYFIFSKKENKKEQYDEILNICSEGWNISREAMIEFGKQRFASGGGFEDETPKEIIMLSEYRDFFGEKLMLLGKKNGDKYKNKEKVSTKDVGLANIYDFGFENKNIKYELSTEGNKKVLWLTIIVIFILFIVVFGVIGWILF